MYSRINFPVKRNRIKIIISLSSSLFLFFLDPLSEPLFRSHCIFPLFPSECWGGKSRNNCVSAPSDIFCKLLKKWRILRVCACCCALSPLQAPYIQAKTCTWKNRQLDCFFILDTLFKWIKCKEIIIGFTGYALCEIASSPKTQDS